MPPNKGRHKMNILRNLKILLLLTAPKLGRPCAGKNDFGNIIYRRKSNDRFYSPLQCNNCAELPQLVTLENKGLTILINFTYSDVKLIPTLTHGPLEGKGTYRFKYAYFNWIISAPMEWRLNDVEFEAEVHLVFYNIQYEDYEKALGQKEGIAILSTWFKVRSLHYLREIDIITDGLKDIREAFTNTAVQNFPLISLLPEITSEYYTYIGTMISEKLFNTSCKSDVIWIDFEQTLKISPQQVAEFKKLKEPNTSVSLIDIAQPYKTPESIVYRGRETVVTDNGKHLSAVGYGVVLLGPLTSLLVK